MRHLARPDLGGRRPDCGRAIPWQNPMPEAKRKRFLFYKEAIHPILKRTQANRVSIRP